MERQLISIFALLLFEFSFAQNELNVNFDEIKTKVEDVNSESHYPKLYVLPSRSQLSFRLIRFPDIEYLSSL